MKFSDIKAIKELIDDSWREAVESMEDGEDDFEVNDYRFIKSDAIDQIQQDELSGDEYMLGCFNSWFLADVLGIDDDVISAMQKAEAYEAIGKLVLSLDKLTELQSEYSRQDGYGHHFNHYDGNEIEMLDYHVFRTN